MRIIKLFFIPIWLAVIIFFQIPAIVIPARTEGAPTSINQNQNFETMAFESADNLFKQNEYDQALAQYKNHIKNFPGGYFVDEAIFQIGEIYILRKNYFMAIRYYELLQKTNFKTDLYNESEYKVAVCYLQLGHYKNALHYFESNYSKLGDGRRKWEIVFLMGSTFEGMKDNLSAFKKYFQSMKAAPEAELKQRSETKILEMIQHKLNLDDLIYLAETLPVEYPLGLVLWRLSEMYESRREYTLYQNYLIRFLNDFPNHEFYKKSKEKLESFLAKSSNIKTKVGCILPLSGEAAASGQKILQGIQLAFSLIPDNKRRDIELIVKDSKGNPEIAAEIVEDLGTDNDVVCIIGPMFSRTAKKAIEKAEIFQIPMISPSASAKGLPGTSQYFFRNSLTQDLQGKAIAEYAVNNLNLNKYILFYSSDSYGIRLKDVFLDQINILGGEILAEKSYAPEEHDFKEQILNIGGMNDEELKKKTLESILEANKNLVLEDGSIIEYDETGIYEDKDEAMSTVLVEIIKQKNEERYERTFEESKIITEEGIKEEVQIEDMPEQQIEESRASDDVDNIEEKINFKPFLKVNYDAIFIPGNPDKVGLIAPQLAFYNIENVQLLGGNSWNSDNIIELGGKYVNGAIFVDGFFSGSYLKQVQEFNELYEYFFGEEPGVLSAQAFDAANMVLDIILKTRVDRQVMKKELLKIKNFKGVSGETTILPNGDSEKTLFFISIKRNKRIQVN